MSIDEGIPEVLAQFLPEARAEDLKHCMRRVEDFPEARAEDFKRFLSLMTDTTKLYACYRRQMARVKELLAARRSGSAAQRRRTPQSLEQQHAEDAAWVRAQRAAVRAQLGVRPRW
jgi:hypothetical protein